MYDSQAAISQTSQALRRQAALHARLMQPGQADKGPVVPSRSSVAHFGMLSRHNDSTGNLFARTGVIMHQQRR
ncbi:MAG: hypothetical protein ACJ8AW_12030 [Rhodopila sp.]